MSRTLFSLVFLLVVALAALVRADDRPAAVKPVVLPAPQTSVTSTAFNPNIQNAGGTTNAAGTFDVVSLARSSNYAGGNDIPKTTSYVVNSANFASSASEVVPGYFTSTSTPTATATQGVPNSSISLISNTAKVVAQTSNAAYTLAFYPSSRAYNSVGLYLLSFAGMVLGALVVL